MEHDAAFIRLESKVDRLTEVLDLRFDAMQKAVEHGDRSVGQSVQIMADSIHRLEQNQREQGHQLRTLDTVPTRVANVEAAVDGMKIQWARLFGIGIGLGVTGGGIGATLIKAFGG